MQLEFDDLSDFAINGLRELVKEHAKLGCQQALEESELFASSTLPKRYERWTPSLLQWELQPEESCCGSWTILSLLFACCFAFLLGVWTRKFQQRITSCIDSTLETCCQHRKHKTANAESTTTKTSTRTTTEGSFANAICEASFDGIVVVDQEGRIEQCNDNLLNMFGYNDERTLLGNPISMLVGGANAKHHQKHFKSNNKVRKGMLHQLRQVEGRRKDGTEFLVTIGLSVLDEERYVAYVRDLTGEQQKMAQIESQRRLFQSILDSSFDSIVVSDSYGRIQRVNQQLLIEFGYCDASEVIGKNVHIFMCEDDARNHDGHFHQFRVRGASRIVGMADRDLQSKRKDGSTFPIKLGIDVVAHQDSSTGEDQKIIVAYIRNVTQELRIRQLELGKVEMEKKAAENLLLNMLPPEIANRLRNTPGQIADHFDNAVILFADLVGFTGMTSSKEAMEVVNILNNLFSRFDELVEDYNLNKIKTIGDAYMVTSIPKHDQDPVEMCTAMAHFALDMLQAVRDYNQEFNDNLKLRIGINTGPVVAGVVGTKRFLYDLWGDAVNIASRMESSGVPNRIQVTRVFVDSVPANEFEFKSRGKVDIKSVGKMETFFLVDRALDEPYFSPKMANSSKLKLMVDKDCPLLLDDLDLSSESSES